MKSARPIILRPGVTAVALALAGALAPAAVDPKAPAPPATPAKAPAATNTVSLVVTFPKSAFNPAVTAGRDPFFPTSKRRYPKPPEVKAPEVKPTPPPVAGTNAPATTAGNAAPPPPVPAPPAPDLIGSANLSLRGIVANATRKWAVVHTGAKSYDFAQGEELLIRLPQDRTLKVRCIAIHARSAVFQAEGETTTKELFLREGL